MMTFPKQKYIQSVEMGGVMGVIAPPPQNRCKFCFCFNFKASCWSSHASSRRLFCFFILSVEHVLSGKNRLAGGSRSRRNVIASEAKQSPLNEVNLLTTENNKGGFYHEKVFLVYHPILLMLNSGV
jgi:hypothetical protein